MPHIEAMQYKSFTTYEWMWSNRDFVNELLTVARSDAIFLNRDHPLSEQRDDQWKNDPKLKGRNHADEWAQKVREGKVYTPLERTYFLGLNEPNSEMYQRQIDAYNEAYCRRMAEHGLRAAAYSFGVGHPSTKNLDPKEKPDWSWYEASAAAVLEGGHIVATHEYGAPQIGGYGWEFWCNRISFCPYPFDVIFDECGIDNGVLQSGQLYGWAKYLKPEEYLLWLDGFQTGMAQRAHTRKVKVLAYNIFGFDHGSGKDKDWHSFDIRPLRKLLEAFQWSVAPTSTPPPVPAPQPVPGGPTAVPSTPAGANVREGPGKNYAKLGAIAKGFAVEVTGKNAAGTWYRVTTPFAFGTGWVSKTVVDLHDVGSVPVVDVDEPQPAPSVPGDNWTRSRAFVAKWEGEFQDFDWDVGNWTGCEVGKGEKKGTKFGISACSYPDLDIRNITLQQADDIYFRDYWQRSGADKLPWPYCLIALDTAVLHGADTAKGWLVDLHGADTAKGWLAVHGNDVNAFVARRLRVYTKSKAWNEAGKAWVNRVADLLIEASKP